MEKRRRTIVTSQEARRSVIAFETGELVLSVYRASSVYCYCCLHVPVHRHRASSDHTPTLGPVAHTSAPAPSPSPDEGDALTPAPTCDQLVLVARLRSGYELTSVSKRLTALRNEAAELLRVQKRQGGSGEDDHARRVQACERATATFVRAQRRLRALWAMPRPWPWPEQQQTRSEWTQRCRAAELQLSTAQEVDDGARAQQVEAEEGTRAGAAPGVEAPAPASVLDVKAATAAVEAEVAALEVHMAAAALRQRCSIQALRWAGKIRKGIQVE